MNEAAGLFATVSFTSSQAARTPLFLDDGSLPAAIPLKRRKHSSEIHQRKDSSWDRSFGIG
jgi:hypothetical protein